MDTIAQYPVGDLPKGYIPALICLMKRNEIRRQRLLAVIQERFEGNKARFAEFVGKKPPQVYRLFSDAQGSRRDIGEDLAREYEQLLGLPRYYLDAPEDSPYNTAPEATDHHVKEGVAPYPSKTPTPITERNYPAAIEPLVNALKSAYLRKSLTPKLIANLQTLVESLAPSPAGGSTTPEADAAHLALSKRLAMKANQDKAIPQDKPLPGTDKADDLDQN